MNIQSIATILCIKDPEARDLAYICLQLPFTFLKVLSAFNTHWFPQLDGAKVYDNSDSHNNVCKSVHISFDELHLVISVDRDLYLGSDNVSTFDTYSRATPCAHTRMVQFFKYIFDDHPALSFAITQFTVCKSVSYTTLNTKVCLKNIKSLPD